jgi:hypothetical protein
VKIRQNRREKIRQNREEKFRQNREEKIRQNREEKIRQNRRKKSARTGVKKSAREQSNICNSALCGLQRVGTKTPSDDCVSHRFIRKEMFSP